MHVTYDRDGDAATIKLVDIVEPGGVARSVPCDDGLAEGAVILDFDAADRLIAIEILGASHVLPAVLLGG